MTVSALGDRPLPFAPINHKSVQDKVYEQITEVMMRGGFEPGQKVSSRKLAAQMSTSDMPVRLALGRLLAEGGLVQHANGTFSVPLISRTKFEEVMTLRALLEGRATHDAAPVITAKAIKELRIHGRGLEAAIEQNDIQAYLDYNQRLKFTIYSYCPSETLQQHIKLLWLVAAPFLRHLNKGLDQMTQANFHNEAIGALSQKRGREAGESISRDILAGMNYLLANAKFADD
ncbi:GntR family transcriptional regulator [Ancylobacter sp.]|uniref:GntR family transcriptional regulator n=1 Tax=Ancylobacter sp. TaxID=1872567 RepID=UPI003C7D6EAD